EAQTEARPRRLPRAIRPEQADDFPRGHRHGQRVEGGEGAVTLGQLFRLQKHGAPGDRRSPCRYISATTSFREALPYRPESWYAAKGRCPLATAFMIAEETDDEQHQGVAVGHRSG